MVFKDRTEAARKLLQKIKKDPLLKSSNKVFVVSLLRGGVILGAILAKSLKATHLPLVVAKIPAPLNPELAIGALCFDITYLERKIVEHLHLKKAEVTQQIKSAEQKFIRYCTSFNLEEKIYNQIHNNIVVLTDDGVATGASMKTALLFLKTKKPKKILLALPVASSEFEASGFDKEYVLSRDLNFTSVSQFYKNFPQVEDFQVKRLLAKR